MAGHISEFLDYIANGVQVFGQNKDNVGLTDEYKTWIPIAVDSTGKVTSVTRKESWTQYDCEEGVLLNGAINQSVVFSNVTTGKEVMISNDSNSYDFSFKINGTSNPSQTLKPYETFTTTAFDITEIYLSNSSGYDISYRVRIEGI